MFVLAAVPAMSRLLHNSASRRTPKPLPTAGFAVAVVVAAITTTGVGYAWRDRGAHLGWVPMSRTAVGAIQGCDGPLFNGFADGGVLTWLVSQRKVFIDSRGVRGLSRRPCTTSRKADLRGKYDELFRQFGIGCAVVDAQSPMAHALLLDWRMQEVYADARWRIFRRRDH